MSFQELSFTANVDRQFLRAANLLDLPPGLAQQIRTCNATYTVRFPVRLRERIHVFTGYRSVHSPLFTERWEANGKTFGWRDLELVEKSIVRKNE